MADIFEQVDEALREDRMKGLWRRYGWMLIAGAVLIVVGTAAIVGWRAYERSQAEAQTNELSAAIEQAKQGEPAAGVASLTELADGAEPNIAALARMQAAGLALGGDDRETAIALYRQVADNAEVDPALRDAATVLGASLSVDSADPDTLRTQLAAQDASNSPWRFLANEIIAAAAIRAGDLETARERLTLIADDLEAPIGLRGRATEVLAAIGGGDDAQPSEDTGAGGDAAQDGSGSAADDSQMDGGQTQQEVEQ